jgi:hypothetical protein
MDNPCRGRTAGRVASRGHGGRPILPLLDSYTAEPEIVSKSEQIPANLHKRRHKQQTTVARIP